jgi:hypothetical protein
MHGVIKEVCAGHTLIADEDASDSDRNFVLLAFLPSCQNSRGKYPDNGREKIPHVSSNAIHFSRA